MPTRPTTFLADAVSFIVGAFGSGCPEWVDPVQRPGRHRWVVERTFAWVNCSRWSTIRYERRMDIHQVFTTLGCCIISFNALQRMC